MKTVQLMVTCLVDSFFPEVGEAVLTVLEKAGLDVQFPGGQTCCGQPAYNAGYWPEARKMALHTLDVFERELGDVIIPSGSCAHMVRHGYMELFRDDSENLSRAKMLAARTYELSEYLVDVVSMFEPPPLERFGIVAYHPSCHALRGLGIDRQPKRLLEQAGIEVVSLEAECCGFGGIFAVEHAELSAAMLERKLHAIEQCECETVVACDVSCLMHIEGGLRKQGKQTRCAHLAQILAGNSSGLR